MCLAIPGQIVETYQEEGMRMGKINFNGVIKRACLEYVPEAQPGDFVLIHVGFALGCIDEAEARQVFAFLEEMNQLEEIEEPP